MSAKNNDDYNPEKQPIVFNPFGKYNLYEKSRTQTKESMNQIYLNRLESQTIQAIDIPIEAFKEEAFSVKTVSELWELLNKIIADINKRQVSKPIPELDKTLLKKIMDTHGCIVSLLVQLFAFLSLPNFKKTFELVKMKNTLEIEIIKYVSVYPYDFEFEFSNVNALKIGIPTFFALLKEGLKNAHLLSDNVNNLETKTSQEVKTSSKQKQDIQSIFETIVDIDQPPMTVCNDIRNKIDKTLAEQILNINQTGKVIDTPLEGQMNSIQAIIMKTLQEEQKTGRLLTPKFFIKNRIASYTYQGDLYHGLQLYTDTIAPDAYKTLNLKSQETRTEERSLSKSVLDFTSAKSKQDYEKNLENETKSTQSNTSENSSYFDNSASLGVNFGAYTSSNIGLNSEAPVSSSGANINISGDVESNTGGSNDITNTLEMAKRNIEKALFKTCEEAEQHREQSATEVNKLTNEKIVEESTTIEIHNPTPYAPADVRIFSLRMDYIVIHCVDTVELYFSNGITAQLIEYGNLDFMFRKYVDDKTAGLIRKWFEKALEIRDYQNRTIKIYEKERVLKSTYKELLSKNYPDTIKSDTEVSKNDTRDKDMFRRGIIGVPFGVSRKSMSIPGFSVEWICKDYALDFIRCKELENQLIASDNKNMKDFSIATAMSNMVDHCKSGPESDSFRTDWYLKLFTNPSEIMSKAYMLNFIKMMETESDSEKRKKESKETESDNEKKNSKK